MKIFAFENHNIFIFSYEQGQTIYRNKRKLQDNLRIMFDKFLIVFFVLM